MQWLSSFHVVVLLLRTVATGLPANIVDRNCSLIALSRRRSSEYRNDSQHIKDRPWSSHGFFGYLPMEFFWPTLHSLDGPDRDGARTLRQ